MDKSSAMMLIVRKLLEQRGITYAKLAAAAEVSLPTITAQLTGVRVLKLNVVDAACRLAGVDASDFRAMLDLITSEPDWPGPLPIRAAAGAVRPGAEPVMAGPVWVTIDGDSMAPRLEDGDRVRVVRAELDQLSQGEAVIAHLAGGEEGTFEFYREGDTIRLLKRNPAKKFRRDEKECRIEDIVAVSRVVEIRRA